MILLGLINALGESKGMLRKNLLDLYCKPLIAPITKLQILFRI